MDSWARDDASRTGHWGFRGMRKEHGGAFVSAETASIRILVDELAMTFRWERPKLQTGLPLFDTLDEWSGDEGELSDQRI